MKWISIKDKLPIINKMVLIYEKGGRIQIASRRNPGFNTGNDFWIDLSNKNLKHKGDSFPSTNVIYWMPLPELPKE